MNLNETPRANRLHIGIYGKRNNGKSTLINALTGQDIALVSPQAGTTTDPVFKAMELHPIGPVVFIDTAGFDDEGELGRLRVERTEAAMDKTDIAVLVIDGRGLIRRWAKGSSFEEMLQEEKRWFDALAAREIPVIAAVNKVESFVENSSLRELEGMFEMLPESGVLLDLDGLYYGELLDSHDAEEGLGLLASVLRGVSAVLGDVPVVPISAAAEVGIDALRNAIESVVPEDHMRERILGGLVKEGDLVMLVMPQDIQAPKGRLILPQVQTLRELLDQKCTAIAATADGFGRALKALNRVPDLIITDSQCFDEVYRNMPAETALTSFSVLFAAYKGDIDKFAAGASALDDMTEKSRVLIAEACTHVPLNEDIGRVKIPALLHKRFGDGLEIVNVCGNDFPALRDLKTFDLVIHCGACMFNRKHVLTRIAAAEAAGVPITNYGIVLAKLAGILDKITLPR